MSGTTITFDEIPADWRVPGTLVEIRPNYRSVGVADYPARALLIGQRLSGSAAASAAHRVTRREDAAALFGLGSVAERMVQAFFDANTTSECWVMGLAQPGGGVAATGTIVLAGTASAAGTLAVSIDGLRVAVPVAASAAAAAVATALAAAITADGRLPVTAAASTGTVTLTARHIGTIGNLHLVMDNPATGDATPAGLTTTITQLTGGTGAAALATALTNVANDWFTDIAVAFLDTAAIDALVADLARRYTAQGQLDAHAYVGLRGTHGALLALGAARNSPHLSMIGANASPSAPWAWAASLCGRSIFHLTNDPARQLRGITLPGIIAPPAASQFIEGERDLLLRDGISTWRVGGGGVVSLERVVTTYQVSTLGVADTAWLDIMTPKVLSRIRYDWRTYLSLTYPRAKLADDGSPAAEFSDIVVTPRRMAGTWSARSAMYERLGWIEDATRTAEASVFVRDATDRNRLNAVQRVRVIGNLMTFAAALEFEA